jgi:hypothetical protein
MTIEQDRRPTKLDTILESFKHPISGHIEISPKIARNILLERLLAYYRATVYSGPSVNLEVLAKMAGDGDDLIDFTEVRRKFIEGRQEERVLLQKTEAEGNILKGKPHQQEI